MRRYLKKLFQIFSHAFLQKPPKESQVIFQQNCTSNSQKKNVVEISSGIPEDFFMQSLEQALDELPKIDLQYLCSILMEILRNFFLIIFTHELFRKSLAKIPDISHFSEDIFLWNRKNFRRDSSKNFWFLNFWRNPE